MKKKLLITLVLAVLLTAPTASAADFSAVSNPLDLLYSWVTSLWDALDGSDRSGDGAGSSFDAPDDEDDPGLPNVGPFADPHG